MVYSPLAESFLVLIILAAYSWPVHSLTQRRTTEKAPLKKRKKDRIFHCKKTKQKTQYALTVRLTEEKKFKLKCHLRNNN